jgi:Matrixin
MMQFVNRQRGRLFRPFAEGLEVRCVLSTPSLPLANVVNAATWLQSAALLQHSARGSELTYSFVPDGTMVYGVPSDLNSAMAAQGLSTSIWQGAVQQAATIWSAATDITFQLVPDTGAPLNTPDKLAEDSGFGDIRIAGITMATSLLAGVFDPLSTNWGTAAGDIVFNTNQPWSTNGSAGDVAQHSANIDLLTVALHEFGHSLGIGESDEPSAVMYEGYVGPKHTLTPIDVAQVPASDGENSSEASQGQGSGSWQTWQTILPHAGDSSAATLIVQAPGFYILRPFVEGQVQIGRTGADGTIALPSATPTGMYLGTGSYRFSVENVGNGPVSFSLTFLAPQFSPEALLHNGVGQTHAIAIQLIVPDALVPGFSVTMPSPSPVSMVGLTPTASAPGSQSSSLPAPSALIASAPLFLTYNGPLVGLSNVGRFASGEATFGERVMALALSSPGLLPGIDDGFAISASISAQRASPERNGRTATVPTNVAADGEMELTTEEADKAALVAFDRLDRLLSKWSEWVTPSVATGPVTDFAADIPLVKVSVGAPGTGQVEQAAVMAPPAYLIIIAAVMIRSRERVVSWLSRNAGIGRNGAFCHMLGDRRVG